MVSTNHIPDRATDARLPPSTARRRRRRRTTGTRRRWSG